MPAVVHGVEPLREAYGPADYYWTTLSTTELARRQALGLRLHRLAAEQRANRCTLPWYALRDHPSHGPGHRIACVWKRNPLLPDRVVAVPSCSRTPHVVVRPEGPWSIPERTLPRAPRQLPGSQLLVPKVGSHSSSHASAVRVGLGVAVGSSRGTTWLRQGRDRASRRLVSAWQAPASYIYSPSYMHQRLIHGGLFM